ncbi:hypothetical protein [Bradyrhizobium sp. BR13661]|uniref:hypothetical protein n=1 Tax=Bradyrhizobium sp. BR13661 TaxID=2940622 RepID=UPI0024754FAD|nr:hypothetical protein [Bradyrhizobium sp. BR13661]MDH6258477.1 signal transduction histidine kinase [Bradyrhizobium sp. BR13661]
MPIDLMPSDAASAAGGLSKASLNPLTIAAAALLMILHFASASLLERSHAKLAQSFVDSSEAELVCSERIDTRAPTLPFD